MGFAVYFLISYLIIWLFIVMSRKLSIIENTFVFLLISSISINVSWIVFQEMNLLTVTDHAVNYVAFLLSRSIILPMVIVVYINVVKRAQTITRFILITVASISVITGLTVLSSFFDIITYVRWNFVFDAIYFGILHLISFYALKLFCKFTYREVNYS